VTLTNTSDVQLNYRAHVPHDGTKPPICFDRLPTSNGPIEDKPALNDNPESPDEPSNGPIEDKPALNDHPESPDEPSNGPIEDKPALNDNPESPDEPMAADPDVAQVVEEKPPSPVEDLKPKEFTVEPSSGILEAESEVTFTVSLCANFMTSYFRELAVNLDEVANETFTIPITAQYVDSVASCYCVTVQCYDCTRCNHNKTWIIKG